MKNNPQNYLTPIAIIVAGIIIASGVVAKEQLQNRLGLSKTSAVQGTETANPNTATDQQAAVGSEQLEFDLNYIKATATDGKVGKDNAPIKMTIFSDYACPYCGAAAGQLQSVIDSLKTQSPDWEPIIPNVITDYVNSGKVQLIFREFVVHGPAAAKAAEAAQCAVDSGKYLEMGDAIFQNQEDWSSETDPTEKLIAIGKSIGVNIADCLKNGTKTASVNQDIEDGQKAGVTGVPTFFVNDEAVVGAQPYSEFKKIVDSKLGS